MLKFDLFEHLFSFSLAVREGILSKNRHQVSIEGKVFHVPSAPSANIWASEAIQIMKPPQLFNAYSRSTASIERH